MPIDFDGDPLAVILFNMYGKKIVGVVPIYGLIVAIFSHWPWFDRT